MDKVTCPVLRGGWHGRDFRRMGRKCRRADWVVLSLRWRRLAGSKPDTAYAAAMQRWQEPNQGDATG